MPAPPRRRHSPFTSRAICGLIALLFMVRAPATTRAADQEKNDAASRERPRVAARDSLRRDATPRRSAVHIAGRVVDEAGHAAPGAMVETFAYPNQTRTISDANGEFKLDLGQDPPRQINVIATSADGQQAYYYLRDARPALPLIELTLRPPRAIEVHVVDADGVSASGASVCAVLYWYQQLPKVTSDATGKAVLRVPADAPLAHVLAKKDGGGFDYVVFRPPNQPPPDFAPPRELLPPESKGPFTLRLDGVLPVAVKVVDEQGDALSGIDVTLTEICRPRKPPLKQIGIDDFRVVTGGDGLAYFSAVPKDNDASRRYAATSRDMAWLSSSLGEEEGGPEVIITMTPRVRLTGRVVRSDGQPAPAAEVTFTSAGYGRGGSITHSTLTDADGNFEYLVVPDQYYFLLASLGSQASASVTRVVRRGEPVEPVDLTLQDATRLHGRITVGHLKRPMKQSWLALYQDPDIANEDLPEADRLPRPPGRPGKAEPRQLRFTYTDNDGNYEFALGPGRYELIAPAHADSPKVVIAGEPEMKVDVHCAKPDRMKLVGRVVLRENPAVGVPRAYVRGESFDAAVRLPIATVCDQEGEFEGEVVGANKALLWARSEDGQLAGSETINVGDGTCEILLARACVARGRLFDVSGENQLADRRIDYWVDIHRGNGAPGRFLGGTTTTDGQGDFRLVGLLPGYQYDVEVVERGVEGQPHRRAKIATIKTAEGGEIDLGDVAVPE